MAVSHVARGNARVTSQAEVPRYRLPGDAPPGTVGPAATPAIVAGLAMPELVARIAAAVAPIVGQRRPSRTARST